jgi:hypothetical protein
MGRALRRPYGYFMTTLQIEHPITDYPTWREAFDGLADIRRKAGVVGGRVARPAGDPHYIFVSLEFDTAVHATTFLEFLETQVWASATTAPALDGRPRTAILESEKDPVI